MNRCESCGREVQGQKYCTNCVKEDGSLKEFDQVAQSLADELVGSQGLHSKAALEVAKSILPKHPAWEHVEVKEIKTKKRWKLVLTIFVIIMLILPSIIFYYIGKKNRVSKELEQTESLSFTPKEISPFSNIKEELVDNETVIYKMICPGDQRLNKLDGTFITFRSLQGSQNSKTWKMYNFDIYNMQGHVFDPNGQETLTFLADMGQPLIYSEENQPICEPKWIYNTKNGKYEQFPESALGHRIGSYYVYEKFHGNPFSEDNNGSSIAYLNLNNGVTLEATPVNSKKKSYHMLNYYSNKKIIFYVNDSEQILYGFDIETKKTFKTLIKETQLTCRGACNDRFVTFIRGWDGLFAYDTISKKYLQLSEKFTNNQMLTNPDKKEETIVAWTENVEIDGDVRSRVLYKTIFDQKSATDISKEDGNMVLLGLTDNYILWSHLKNPLEKSYNNINGISVLDLGYDLWVYDLWTKKNYKLEKDQRGDFRYSKEYIIWEKRNSSEPNQGYNICFASSPPQPIGQMESKGESPIENVIDAEIIGEKVKEIRCQGDQVVKNVIGDVMFLSSLENLHSQEWKDYILNLSNFEGCEFNKNQPSSQVLNILKMTNQKIAWQKEKYGTEVIVYNPEDNSIREYKNNNLRDRRIVGQYDGNIIYIVDDNYDSNIFVYYPESNEDIAVGNDDSLWIKLLFDDSIYNDSQIIYQLKSKRKTQQWIYDITNRKRIKIGETVVGYTYSKSSNYVCLVEALIEKDPITKENKTRRSIIDINTGDIISNNPNFSNILKGKEYTILGGDTNKYTYCIWTEKSLINGKTQEEIAYISFDDIYNNRKCSLIKVSEGYQFSKIISRNISEISGVPTTWTQMENNSEGNISNLFLWSQTDIKNKKLKVMGTQLNKNITNTILEIDLESSNTNILVFLVNEKYLWWKNQIGRKDNQGTNIFFSAIP